MTDIKPVLNCKTPSPSLIGSKFWDNEYACLHTANKNKIPLEQLLGTLRTSMTELKDISALPSDNILIQITYTLSTFNIDRNMDMLIMCLLVLLELLVYSVN